MNSERDQLIAGLASAQISLFGILVDNLHQKGVVDRRDIAGELKRIILVSEGGDQKLQKYQRMIFGEVLAWLGGGSEAWKPVVVGGSEHEAN